MIGKIFNAVFKNNGSINIENVNIENNNKQIHFSAGDSVYIANRKIYINGEEKENLNSYKGKEIKITINGDISGSVEAGNFTTINGNVGGDVDCGNMCTIESDIIKGNIDTGNMSNITAKTIEGKIDCGNMCNISK